MTNENPAPTSTSAKQISVESIMTTEVSTVSPMSTVRDAIVLLTTKKISGAPVVDNKNSVMSVVSEGDLLRLAAAVGLDKQLGHCLDRLPKVEALITARANDAFTEAYKMFLTKGIHRIIVTDDNGKLRGIVSRSNVLRVLVDKPVATN